jgi:hypothetical protein
MPHTASSASKAKQAAQALLHQQDTAAAARDALVQEKQRLEMVARELGISRKKALLLANAYFTNQPPHS